MDVDWTVVLFEVVNFVVLVAILARFLFRPIREALERRKSEIESRDHAMRERERENVARAAELTAALEDIEARAEARLAESLADARKQADGIVQNARAKARGMTEAAEAELDEMRRRELERLRPEVFALATDAANRLVTQVGGAPVTETFARHAAHALAEALEREGPSSGGRPTVRIEHGEDADPSELRRIVVRELAAETGAPSPIASGGMAGIETRVDPQLGAGVRLVAGPHVIEASAARSLSEWYGRRVLGSGDAAA